QRASLQSRPEAEFGLSVLSETRGVLKKLLLLEDIAEIKSVIRNLISRISQELAGEPAAKDNGGDLRRLFEATSGKKDELNELIRGREKIGFEKNVLNSKLKDLESQAAELGRQPADFQATFVKTDGTNPADLSRKIFRLRGELAAIGEIEPSLLEEAEKTEERYQFLQSQRADLEKASLDIKTLISGLDKKIQTGIFELQEDLSVKKLAEIITNPETAEMKLTFLEGWNLRDYGHYLEGLGLFQAEELHEVVGFPTVDYRFVKDMPVPLDFVSEFTFLQDKPRYLGLEGYLFPDTYFFKKHATIKQIVEKMLENFGRKLTPELRAEIKRQKKDIFDIVTTASLLEAEAREEEDRRLISDIVWRRLAIGMSLQLDSTVNYVTGGKKPAISSAEQLVDSPYNT
ncbi:MAG: endolytic transglycosylase MltG, partial [Patescibacteria group bacterium]